jgi:hypothetical protein
MEPTLPPLEHDTAYYRNTDFKQAQIDANELVSDQRYAFAQATYLTDRDESIRLHPRRPDGKRPHFYAKSEHKRSEFRGENNPAHNLRVERVLERLSRLEAGWKLVFEDYDAPPEVLYDCMPKYTWDKEVTRILTDSTAVRHDIYGEHLQLRTSDIRPSVAVEVVHSHYPDDASFSAMLEETQRLPKLILFDHTFKDNKFVRVESPSKVIVRYFSFWMKEGKVYHGNKGGKITNARELRLALEQRVKRFKELDAKAEADRAKSQTEADSKGKK